MDPVKIILPDDMSAQEGFALVLVLKAATRSRGRDLIISE